ncbi:MAG: sensory rhodopsin transducer [Candidatus Cloacimonetes bacterium]|nr:sensory rhodopsin transducer [Candidatus Cloacimonadota bacterium]
MALGKKTWVFADGDLPPHGEKEPFGHEALMVVNNGEQDAKIELEFLFEDKEPQKGVHITVPAKRVNCFRMDYPVGDEKFSVPFGQYALILNSDVPVVCLYGRLDRRPDMAYYPIGGFSN